VVFLVLVFVLGIFILYIIDISFPNFFQSFFTTIHCDSLGDDFKDHLIILQSFHNQLVVPLNGYDITDENVFLDMFNKKPRSLGVSLCSDSGTGIPNFKGPAVYIIDSNKKTCTVHPFLVDLIFEMFGIND